MRSSPSTVAPRRERDAEAGFTLIEVMVALLIFSMIALAGIAILSFSIRAQAGTGAKLDDLGALDRTMSTLGADLAQAQARPSRDERGTARPAFVGEAGSAVAPMLSLVRGGWTNIDAVPRATAQKIVWRVDGHVLVRQAYPMLDGAAPLAPAAMMTKVRSVAFRYRYAGRLDGALGRRGRAAAAASDGGRYRPRRRHAVPPIVHRVDGLRPDAHPGRDAHPDKHAQCALIPPNAVRRC